MNTDEIRKESCEIKGKRNRIFRVRPILAMLLAVACFIVAGCADASKAKQTAPETVDESKAEDTSGQEDKLEASHYVKIEIEDYGTITVALIESEAPETVANFVELVKSGFYDGLTFHRIISGFMIQGGDPLGNGTGGSDKEIKGEFYKNRVKNRLSHVRGAISMARGEDPNSASSQFFIVHKDSTFLDGNYACFGYVTDGIEVVDKICEDASPVDNNGTIPRDAQPVIKSIVLVDGPK